MKNLVPKTEAKIVALSLSMIVVMVALIAYAAFRLGISVPTCVTQVKPFTEGAWIPQGPKRFEAHIYARMWRFEPNHFRVPTGSTIDFYLASRDITHGFHIEKTNVNLMAVPGSVNFAQATFRKPGQYRIFCHEYCGTGHHSMSALIEVADDIQEGTAEGMGTTLPAELLNHPAYSLLEEKGCLACHSVDGSPATGPSLRGLWGRKEEMADGKIIPAVDAAYLRAKLSDPSKTTVKGFDPSMPPNDLTPEEQNRIIEFIEKIK